MKIIKQRLELLQILHNAEMYEEMKGEMLSVLDFCIKEGIEMTPELRAQVGNVYKKLMSKKRGSWRSIQYERAKITQENSEVLENLIKFSDEISTQIKNISEEFISLIDGKISEVKGAKDVKENQAFFLKAKGDYLRYQTEVLQEQEKKEIVKEIQRFYEEAEIICNELEQTNPVRLGLYLNLSIFYYETMREYRKGIEIAQKTFDDGIKQIVSIEAEEYKDITLILQLVRDNLNLWNRREEDKIAENIMNVEDFDGDVEK